MVSHILYFVSYKK